MIMPEDLKYAETGKSLQSYPIHNMNKSSANPSMNHIPEHVGLCMPDRHPYQTHCGLYPRIGLQTKRLYILLMTWLYFFTSQRKYFLSIFPREKIKNDKLYLSSNSSFWDMNSMAGISSCLLIFNFDIVLLLPACHSAYPFHYNRVCYFSNNNS